MFMMRKSKHLWSKKELVPSRRINIELCSSFVSRKVTIEINIFPTEEEKKIMQLTILLHAFCQAVEDVKKLCEIRHIFRVLCCEKFYFKNNNYERNEAEVINVRYENDTAS